jgi:hypothetical protein
VRCCRAMCCSCTGDVRYAWGLHYSLSGPRRTVLQANLAAFAALAVVPRACLSRAIAYNRDFVRGQSVLIPSLVWAQSDPAVVRQHRV